MSCPLWGNTIAFMLTLQSHQHVQCAPWLRSCCPCHWIPCGLSEPGVIPSRSRAARRCCRCLQQGLVVSWGTVSMTCGVCEKCKGDAIEHLFQTYVICVTTNKHSTRMKLFYISERKSSIVCGLLSLQFMKEQWKLNVGFVICLT